MFKYTTSYSAGRPEMTVQSMVDNDPTLLYPHARLYPFDEACEQIVRALEQRGWSVPGVHVELATHSCPQFRLVRSIWGDDFRLHFNRVQGSLGGGFADTAAASQLIIPRRELHVHAEVSCPCYYVYAGRNWPRDRADFMTESKCESRLYGRPRTYLMYAAGCSCGVVVVSGNADALAPMRHTHDGRHANVLVADDNCGREYSPQLRDPKVYRTNEVFAEFTSWLRDNLLARILVHPVRQ